MSIIFKKIINGYPAIIAPYSSELLRTGILLFFLAKISTFYKIKMKDDRGINNFCNVYFLHFGGSGEGKGRNIRAFEKLDCIKKFEKEEKEEIKQFEKINIAKYIQEYEKKYSIEENDIDDFIEEPTKAEKRSEKKKAITYARNKIKNVQPLMCDSTRPNMEQLGIAVGHHNKISVSIQNEEFLMWIKRKQKESYELFEILAELYDEGKAITKGTVMANRGIDESKIKNFPVNTLFLSSKFLIKEKSINELLQDFLIVAGARRFFISSEKELVDPIYSKEECKSKYEGVKTETDIYLSRYINACRNYANEGIKISEEVQKEFVEDDEKIREVLRKKTRTSELLKISIGKSYWKTLKISGLIALLEHPNENVIKINDYRFAKSINSAFLNSFKKIVDENWENEVEQVIKYIKKNQGCSKGELISNVDFFAKKRELQNYQYRNIIDQVESIVLYQGFSFLVKKGLDGKSLEHYIKEVPKDLKEDDNFLYQFSFSADMAKGYKAQQLTLEQMLKCLQNKKKINYSPGSYKNEHRTQENWEGGANCLVLDIDNEKEELTIEQAKKIFENYTYIIQPTKSHKIEKSSHGIKERFRLIFPTKEIPKMATKKYRNIYDNFHKAFGISEHGDIKASGDIARFYYPSPHKAEYHKGERRINWEIYDIEEKEIKKTSPKTCSKSYSNTGIPVNVRPELATFFSKYQFLKKGEKARVKCPLHDDKKSSAFVARHENGTLYLNCSVGSCLASNTIFEK